MKTLMIRFAFAFACFVPACGGRVGGDFDQSTTTNVDDIDSDETTGGQQGMGGSSATTTASSATGGATILITAVTGGATSVTTSTSGTNGILRLHEPTAGSLPDRTVLPGEKDITVFEFTLSAEQRAIRLPRMYVAVDGSIKDNELMPVTIVDEANNIVATENPTPFGEVYTFGEFGGAFWFTPFTVYESAPPKMFRVKTGIEPTAQIGKTFRFGIETSTSLCGNADDNYEVRSCPLAVYGNRFTIADSPLVVSLSKNTPQAQIVTPRQRTASEGYIFSRYTIRNQSMHDIPFLNVTVNGTISSLYSEGIFRCDTGTGMSAEPPKGNTHLNMNTSGGGSMDWNIPANGEIELCLKGSPAVIDSPTENNGNPKSGDLLHLELVDVYTNDGIHARFDATTLPPKMVLRKAEPVIMFQPITDRPKIGKSRIASAIISNASETNALALQQLEFRIEAGAMHYKQIRDEQGNPASVYINGVASPSSMLFSEADPTFVVVKFIDGDHLITKSTPMTIDIYVDVVSLPSEAQITTKLLNTWPLDSYTGSLQLVGLDSPGQIIAWKVDERQNPSESTMFWSDLSAGTEHIPFTGGFTSGDFFTGALVAGMNDSLIVTTP